MFKVLKKSKVASNAVWIIIGKVAQSILSLIVGMMTARYMGPSNYGLISYAASIVAFVVPIMNLGLSNVLVQEYTNQPEKEGEIFGSAIVVSILSSLCCIFGVTLFTLFFDNGKPETNLVVILYSLMLIFQAFELITYWFQAKFLSKYVAIASFISYGVVSAYKILLLAKKASIFWFALSNSIDYFLIALLLIITYKKLGGRHFRFSKRVATRMLSSSKHYIVSSLMVTIFAQTDRIMLKGMMNEAAVGYYTAAVTCAGISQFIFGALIVGVAAAILLVMQKGMIVDTIIYYAGNAMMHVPKALAAEAMLILQTLLNFFIPSGSGQAATIMPIMAPIADMLGLSRQVAVLAYQFGDGLSNTLWPTCGIVVSCGLAGVPIDRWWKFFVPLFGIIFVAVSILLAIAVAIGL